MSNFIERSQISEYYVLVFDICSSTSILEDLIKSNNEQLWRDLHIKLKKYLFDERDRLGFILYKFIGDGWILLFDINFSLKNLFKLLKDISLKYDAIFKKNINPVLSTDVGNVGITFGLDRGKLMKVKMNSQNEYLGRPLNVASRLQTAIKDKDKKPQGKVLMSNNVHSKINITTKRLYKIVDVERKLRNISGGKNYKAKKLLLFD